MFEARKLEKVREPAGALNRSHRKVSEVTLNTEGLDPAEHRGERFYIGHAISGFDFEANYVAAPVEILGAHLRYGEKRRSDVYLGDFFKVVGGEKFCSSRVSNVNNLQNKIDDRIIPKSAADSSTE